MKSQRPGGPVLAKGEMPYIAPPFSRPNPPGPTANFPHIPIPTWAQSEFCMLNLTIICQREDALCSGPSTQQLVIKFAVNILVQRARWGIFIFNRLGNTSSSKLNLLIRVCPLGGTPLHPNSFSIKCSQTHL